MDAPPSSWSVRSSATSAALPAKRAPRPPPHWTLYLEFHNIKRALGLSTASLVAFVVGMACLMMAGIAVGMIYSVQTFNDFQAVQLYRMQWLLGRDRSLRRRPAAKKIPRPEALNTTATTTHVGPDALVRAGEQRSPKVSCSWKPNPAGLAPGRAGEVPPLRGLADYASLITTRLC